MPAFRKGNHDVCHSVAKKLLNTLAIAVASMYIALCRNSNIHLPVSAMGNDVYVITMQRACRVIPFLQWAMTITFKL